MLIHPTALTWSMKVWTTLHLKQQLLVDEDVLEEEVVEVLLEAVVEVLQKRRQ